MAKPSPRDGYHHGDLRAALIAAATQLVREHGAAGFSLREAARQVGVDPAACYRHFRNRSDLLLAIAQHGFATLADKMARATAALVRPSWDKQLVALARVYVRFAFDHPAEFRVMFGESGTHAHDQRLRLPTVERSPYQQLEELVGAWSKDEGLRLDVTQASRALWSGAHGVARLVVDGALELSTNQALALAETVTLALFEGQRRARG